MATCSSHDSDTEEERIKELEVEDDVFRSRLERHRKFLEERIDPDFGLLDRLRANRAVTYLQCKEVSAERVSIRKSGMIIDYILQHTGSEMVSKFCEALKETKQEHLVNYMHGNGEYNPRFGGNWPLRDAEVSILDDNIVFLTERIDSDYGLSRSMFQKNVITQRQMESISTHKDPYKRNEVLLDIIRRGSQSEFQGTIEALKASDQKRIADVLIHGGMVLSVHSNADSISPAIGAAEEEIVQKIDDILQNKTSEERGNILAYLSLKNKGLIAANQKRSIVFYFHCKHLEAFRRLVELLETKELQKDIEKIYNSVLSTASKPNVTVNLTWNEVEFNEAERKFQGLLHTNAMTCSKVNVPTSDVRMKEIDDMITCCICTQKFESPKMLPCSHTFCLKCLKSYAVDKKPGEKISCPICRREYKIPIDGVQGFQRNNFVEKLAELAQTLDSESKEVICDVCQDNADDANDEIPVAHKHCIDCQQNMCENCAFHHKRNKITKQHKVIDRESRVESTLATANSERCEKHVKKPLVLFCIDCSVPICQQCFQETHSRHKVQDVKQRADSVKRELERTVTNISQFSDEMKNFVNEELPKSLLDVIGKTESEIHERGMEVRRISELHEKRLCEYLETVKKRKQKEFCGDKTDAEQCISEMDSFLKMARKLQEHCSISELSSTWPILMSRARKLQAKYDGICKTLKTKAVLHVTEFVPVDIDDLLSSSTGNLIGKIKVSIAEKGPDKDNAYHGFPRQYDVDDEYDPYANCIYIPEQSGGDAYSRLPEDFTRLHVEQRQSASSMPTACGILPTRGGDSVLAELQPSAVALRERLYVGDFTDIWLGTLNSTTDVSVRTYKGTKEAKEVETSDFFCEAKTLQKLRHPKIVNLIGVSKRSSPFYVITEYATNGYLDKYLKDEKERRTTQLAMKEVIYMAAQIADAMHYLETMNCIHRFLAARSILVGTNYLLKLANFEMAVILDRESFDRDLIHKDEYEFLVSPVKIRAPEVLDEQKSSNKSDVWSFAIVIYKILTYDGEPYPDLPESGFATDVLTTDDFPCPAGPNFTYPDPKLGSIVESCWKMDPDERPDFKNLRSSFCNFFKEQDDDAQQQIADDMHDYMRRPKPIKTLKLKGPVSGFTMYKDEIYIIRSDSTTIDVINASNFKRGKTISTGENKKFFSLLKKNKTQNFNGFRDITSCKKNSFIYVISWQDSIIHQINLVLRSVHKSWEVMDGDPTTLAVTPDGNLLVSCASDGKVLEFAFDGTLVNEISFACNGEGPLHTMQLASDRFVVCHGRREDAKSNEGVTVIDKYGNGVPEVKPLALTQSCHLAIDSNNNVLIVATGRNKLIIWNPENGSQRVLISLDQEHKVPTRIHVNESTGQLLMLFQNDTLMIYQVKSTETAYKVESQVNNDHGLYAPYRPMPMPQPP